MEEKIIYNSTDNIRLCGLLSKINDSKKIVILCHGLKGDKTERNAFTELTKQLQENDYNSFRFDFRGHGESTGNDYEMTITKEIKDLEASINLLIGKGYEEFILLGASFGAGIISLIDYKKYPGTKGLICWYGALDYKATIEEDAFFSEEHRKIAEKQGYWPIISRRTGKEFKLGLELYKEVDKLTPYKELIKANIPKLFVHGKADTMIHYSLSEKVNSMCINSKLELIDEGEHCFFTSEKSLNSAIKKTINFIKETL